MKCNDSEGKMESATNTPEASDLPGRIHTVWKTTKVRFFYEATNAGKSGLFVRQYGAVCQLDLVIWE